MGPFKSHSFDLLGHKNFQLKDKTVTDNHAILMCRHLRNFHHNLYLNYSGNYLKGLVFQMHNSHFTSSNPKTQLIQERLPVCCDIYFPDDDWPLC